MAQHLLFSAGGSVVAGCLLVVFQLVHPPAHLSCSSVCPLIALPMADYIGAGGKCQSGAGKVKPVRFTDDTAMARSIVRSVLVRQSVDAKDIARRWAVTVSCLCVFNFGGFCKACTLLGQSATLAICRRMLVVMFVGCGLLRM